MAESDTICLPEVQKLIFISATLAIKKFKLSRKFFLFFILFRCNRARIKEKYSNNKKIFRLFMEGYAACDSNRNARCSPFFQGFFVNNQGNAVRIRNRSEIWEDFYENHQRK